jgi:hypothetical protein
VPAWCTPLGIGFLHDLPNKPLTGLSILHHLENKGDNLQDLQNAGVMVSLELLGETQAWGWWILSPINLIIRSCVKGGEPVE